MNTEPQTKATDTPAAQGFLFGHWLAGLIFLAFAAIGQSWLMFGIGVAFWAMVVAIHRLLQLEDR